MGGEEAAKILSFAREHGVVTSADILAPGEQAAAILDWIAPAFPHLDYLLPNDEQVLALSGATELLAGCRALLDRGVGCVAATCGAEGAVVVDAGGRAASAGVRGRRRRHHRLRRRVLGWLPARSRARARRAATRRRSGARWRRSSPRGLGSDHGDFDLAAADAFINHSNKAVSR